MKTLFVVIPTLFTLSAQAAPHCTSEPKEKWMEAGAMQNKLLAEGYKIKKFKTEDTCYEIYGWDKEGKKVEIYFNPVSGEIVKRKEWK